MQAGCSFQVPEPNPAQIEHLKLVIEKYRRMIFGRKSEKLTRELEQLRQVAQPEFLMGPSIKKGRADFRLLRI